MKQFANISSKQVIRNFKLYIISDMELEMPYRAIYDKLNFLFKNKYTTESSNMTYIGSSKDYIYMFEKNNFIYLNKNSIYRKFSYIKYGNLDLNKRDIIETTEWFIKNILNINLEIAEFSRKPGTGELSINII